MKSKVSLSLVMLAAVCVGVMLACGGNHSESVFTYCKAVVTIDRPDARWTGPSVPDRVLAVLEGHLGPSIYPKATSWRCMNSKVYGCNPGANLWCGPANTSTEPTDPMRIFCTLNPDAGIPAAIAGHDSIYSWNCAGKSPQKDRQVFHTDERGFVSELWYKVTP